MESDTSKELMEEVVIKTDEEDRCDGIPACFFDMSIFNFLDNNKNFTLTGRTQQHHSVTLFPMDKKDKKINMPSYTLGQQQPFVYQAGASDNKFIGFAVELDNNTRLLEGSKVNGSTCYQVGILGDGIYSRGGNTLCLRKPRIGETNMAFWKDMLKTYGSMADYMEGKSTAVRRGKSPLEQHNHPNGIKSLNNSDMMAIDRTLELPSTRISYNKKNKKITYPYNEQAIGDNILESKFIILDGRKRVPLSPTQKQMLFYKIKDYNRVKNIKGICAYAIDEDNVIKPFDEKGVGQILDAICSNKGKCKDVKPFKESNKYMYDAYWKEMNKQYTNLYTNSMNLGYSIF